MAERRKRKDKNAGRKGSPDRSNKLTKEDDALARFVRFNCPTNTTMFEGNEVHYFSGKKAVDVLVESKKYGAAAKKPKFVDNSAAEEFLQSLLAKGLFFRAKKLVPKKKDKTENSKESRGEVSKGKDIKREKAENKEEKEKEQRREKEEHQEEEENNAAEEGKEDKDANKKEQDEEKKKKRKVKLLFHDVQAFDASTSDVYVWIFDPTPLWKKCVGILIVLGTIGGCLFPLWPDWLRLGIYYLSVTGIALFGLLLGVALARTILYGIIWLFTLGRHHFWFLPNLMEDCGFFESFQPIYTYEYVSGGFFGKKDQKKKKAGEDPNREKDAENSDDKTPLIPGSSNEEGKADKQPDAGEEESSNHQKDDNKTTKIERKSSGGSEGSQPKKEDADEEEEMSGSEEEDAESQRTGGTDDSNSWEKLSEKSQKSSSNGENGGKKGEEMKKAETTKTK